jgi:hypothetical protein
MVYTVNVTKFAPFYEGAPLVSTYEFEDVDMAIKSASQSACMAFSDSIEVIDEQGRIHASWTSLYNFIYRFKDSETPDESFTKNLNVVVKQIERYFIPELSNYLTGRIVSFVDGGEEITFTIIPGTESFFFDACMDAGCEGEDAREEGILDYPVMKTVNTKYSEEIALRQQRYEERKQRQLNMPY